MIKKTILNLTAISLLVAVTTTAEAQTTVDFEGLGEQLGSDSAYRGEDEAGQFSSAPLTFRNNYNPTFDSWNGAAYSNRTSWTLGGASGFEEFQFGNDTVVASPSGGSGTGAGGSATWGVFFGFAPNEARFEIAPGSRLDSFWINNTRTTAHVIENGNSSATAFGSGDFFEVIFNSIEVELVDGMEVVTVLASSEPITLAEDDSVLRDWTLVDLAGSNIADARMIGLEFRSSDVGMFGINTPTYVAIDDITLVAVPEPSAIPLLVLVGLISARRKRIIC
jgi:hypothetical protein